MYDTFKCLLVIGDAVSIGVVALDEYIDIINIKTVKM